MSFVGYARVSSIGQSLDLQLEKLSSCEKLFQEKASATSDNLPELKECLNYVREGDTLVVTRLDRLARSTLHLCQISEILTTKKVNLKVIDQSIDTNDATGRLLFNMLGAIGQFETEIRKERQIEGIAKAKNKGVYSGRKNKLDEVKIVELKQKRQDGVLIKDLMKEFNISKASVYRYLI